MKQDKPNQARLSSDKKTTLPQAANRRSASAKLRSEQTESRVVWPKTVSGVTKLIIENPDGKLFAELPLTEPEFAAIKRGARKKLMSVPEFVRSAVVAMLAKVESQLEGGIR